MKKVLLLAVSLACAVTMNSQNKIDIQGHRGCRGLMPENTIPAFLKALDLGVRTLELDVVVTKDRQVLVSHDHYMNAAFCLDPSGQPIAREKQEEYNLYRMTMDEIRKFDCGSLPHEKFPGQHKMKVTKPLLSEVIDAVENHVTQHGLPPALYNIEIKCSPEGDNLWHPTPEVMTDLVLKVMDEKGITGKSNIQSFDVRPLQYLHKIRPEITTAFLIMNVKSMKQNLEKLGYLPDTYSPYYRLAGKKLLRDVHALGMTLVPWTVNEVKDIRKMIRLRVDGIISDYPDRVLVQVK